MSFGLRTRVGVLGLGAFLGHVSVISADETKSFVNLTLLLLRGELAVGAKFAGKVLGVRRIIVGLGSGVIVVIGITGVVVGVVATVLVR